LQVYYAINIIININQIKLLMKNKDQIFDVTSPDYKNQSIALITNNEKDANKIARSNKKLESLSIFYENDITTVIY